MKNLLLFFSLFVTFSASANENVFAHLKTINTYWSQQKDLSELTAFATENYTDRDWIRLHLSLVEQTLRNRTVNSLNATQRANRLHALDCLHNYWQQGNFPINDQYSYRTPIFIDRYNNFCAVGYIMKATGYENISRKVEATLNLAYVKNIPYSELKSWASDFGFTVDELAWIQPSYGPLADRKVAPLGKGTNGNIYELFVNENDDTLYVGGNFTQADSSVNVGNMAYVTENNGIYSWHDLGGGVNGTVYAIQEFQGNLFVGGSFTMAGGVPATNIAYWDGNVWHSAGCIYGTIKDLIVYNNELYAAGDFDVCAAMSEVNISKWDGTMWGQQLQMLEGHVNTLEEYDGALFLGGHFSYLGDTVNIIKWTAANGYEKFDNGIENEVMDIGKFKDSVYAVCKKISAADSFHLIQKLSENSWTPLDHYPIKEIMENSFYDSFIINTMCVQDDTLVVAGNFTLLTLMSSIVNFLDIYNLQNFNTIYVDSAINKMTLFKNELIIAGNFNYGFKPTTGMGQYERTTLNHIGKKLNERITSVPEIANAPRTLHLYPNPITRGQTLYIESDFQANEYTLRSVDGRMIQKNSRQAPLKEIQLPEISSGLYWLELANKNGEKSTQKLIIK